jgi:hypothetical protein
MVGQLLDRELTEPGDQGLLPQAAGEKLGLPGHPPVRNIACTCKIRIQHDCPVPPGPIANNRTGHTVNFDLNLTDNLESAPRHVG